MSQSQPAQRGSIKRHKRMERIALERCAFSGSHHKAMIECRIMGHHDGATATAVLNAFTNHFKNGVQGVIFAYGTTQWIRRVDTVKCQRFWL